MLATFTVASSATSLTFRPRPVNSYSSPLQLFRQKGWDEKTGPWSPSHHKAATSSLAPAASRPFINWCPGWLRWGGNLLPWAFEEGDQRQEVDWDDAWGLWGDGDGEGEGVVKVAEV